MYYNKLPNVELLRNLMNINEKKEICKNCGKINHNYKDCSENILSYGIICFNRKTESYILIKRRYSISFFDFIQGKYIITNLNFIIMLFENMTKEEKKLLLENDFNYLWGLLNDDQDSKNKYISARNKFYIMKDGIYNNNKIYNIEFLINNTECKELEFEFPKGRRNKYETDFECALREFQEETGIIPDCIDYIHLENFYEKFIGSNGKQYEYIYFLLIINDDIHPQIIKTQEIEVGGIYQMSFEDLLNVLNIRKKSIILKIKSVLSKLN